MLDPHFICNNTAEVEESCRRRGVRVDVQRYCASIRQLRAGQQELEKQVAAQKVLGRQLASLQGAAKEQCLAQAAALKEQIRALQKTLGPIEEECQELHRQIPNCIDPQVPEGGAQDFRLLRIHGTPRPLEQTPKSHSALCRALDLCDFEAGTKVAGSKFFFLKNEAVLLEQALISLVLQRLKEAGFTLLTTPDVAHTWAVEGAGFSPRGEESQIYQLAGSDLCLLGTSEIAIAASCAQQTIDAAHLPLCFAAVSHCFRKEAGSYGQDSQGLYRVHQFTKVEAFVFSHPDSSHAYFEKILALQEALCQALALPYRVIEIAAGDLGAPAARKVDIEVWMPSRGDYGEVTSTSHCTDYQARRLGIRYKEKTGRGLVHTLNGTGIAIPRIIMALLENGQQPDGSIVLPPVLHPWMGEKIG